MSLRVACCTNHTFANIIIGTLGSFPPFHRPMPHVTGTLFSQEKGGIGFEDHGGELELYDLNITQSSNDLATLPEPTLLGSVKTSTLFGSIAWGRCGDGGDVSTSILAGGMVDGTVNLWRPSALLGGEDSGDALLASVQRHRGVVSALKFNPHADSSNLLATGGSSGQVWMMDISQTVNVYSPNGDDVNG